MLGISGVTCHRRTRPYVPLAVGTAHGSTAVANSVDLSVHSASTWAAAIVGVGASHLAWNPTSNRWIDTWEFHVDRSSERRDNFGIV